MKFAVLESTIRLSDQKEKLYKIKQKWLNYCKSKEHQVFKDIYYNKFHKDFNLIQINQKGLIRIQPMQSQTTEKYKVKLIKLSDTYTDHSREFPYVHRINANIRFRLRSRITYDHQPVLLIEKLNSFDYILPMMQQFDLGSKACQENFICLKGKYDPDGAWYVELPEFVKVPGIVSFQIAFVPFGSVKATRYGTCDVVFLTQEANQLRKLRKQSVFPRCIGKYNEWTNYFKRQMELGYNSFHFAPIQQTGESKSYYSLKDHLDLSDDLFSGRKEEKKEQLKQVLDGLKKQGVVFFIDIVLNHCSFDAEWIRDHPDAVYTPENTPALRPAFEVDQIIYLWGNEIKALFTNQQEDDNKLQFNQEFSKEIESNLRKALYSLNLEQYFILSQQVEKTLLSSVTPRKPSQNLFAKDPINLIEQFIEHNICNQCTSKRQVKLKNIDKWKQLNIAYEIADLKMAINYYNNRWINKIKDEWIPEIVNNTMNEVRHNYLHNSYREFEDPYPFVSKYFSRIPIKKGKGDGQNGEECFYALNNGWVGGADSRENFAISKQFYYLRRRVNVWGDLLRIRYGDKPSDSPYAWEYMKTYVQEMATQFQGFRLDNCHGTQLNVARYMVKQARVANPNVVIFAELFTNNDEQKALFVRSIGINSVLKETQHMLSGPAFIYNIYDSLGKGATYVGGLNRYMEERNQLVKYSTRKKPILLVYDLTHDNMTYCEKKIQVLQTPITVIISLMGAFIGSTKGYDQFYAKKVQVIETKQIYAWDNSSHPKIDKSEIQKLKFTFPSNGMPSLTLYGSWNNWKQGTEMILDVDLFWAEIEIPPGHYEYKFHNSTGEWLTHPSKDLNSNGNHQHNLPSGELAYKDICSNLQCLRTQISETADRYFKYSEYFCFHKNDVVVIIRQGEDHEGSICAIANLSTKPQKIPDGIELFGKVGDAEIWVQNEFALYEGHLFITEIVHSKNIREYFDVTHNNIKGNDILFTNELPVGFGCVIECRKTKQKVNAIREIRQLVNRPIRLPQINALDANMILYGSARQEQTIHGMSNYTIPQDGNKQLVYGGFGGIFIALKNAKKQNDLSVKLFDNLREGNWLMDYYVSRLKRYQSLTEVADKVEKVFNSIKTLERYLVPKYFADFVYRMCHAVEDKMSGNSMSIFERKLKTSTVQFINKFNNQKPGFQVLFAAGLPHFAAGWTRCWGRDTFISNELLLEHPQVYKVVILQFAAALRHGMIPNLLDNGNNPRYNCRDACWWFIRGVKEYARKTGDYQIFKEKVNMLFLSNDLIEHNYMQKEGKSKTMIIQDIIHEILQTHAHGIYYREWRAGYEIDSNMNTEGFNIQLTVDDSTGFINGGNQFNCLTWMDKMGSSVKAGNKGYPATPRAGQPVELVGLLYHCLTSLAKLHEEGHYTHDEVVFKKRKVKYSEWANMIKHNFDNEFYIPQEKFGSSQDLKPSRFYAENHHDESARESKINPAYVRLRGIYKDVRKAKIINEEYRLRPNALITLALAPQIVTPEHARAYLANVETYLLYPKSVGMATLAEVHESLYLPYYDNSDNSAQVKAAHGFSYHNGPEWVWLYGFYVTAKINFDSDNTTKQRLLGLLQEHNNYINNDEWCSLPEMTNKNGEFNRFSCPAQAWSISSLLMAWNAIQEIPEKEEHKIAKQSRNHAQKNEIIQK